MDRTLTIWGEQNHLVTMQLQTTQSDCEKANMGSKCGHGLCVCVCVSCLALPGQWRRQRRQSTNQLTVSQSTTLKVSRDCSSLISAPISLPLHFIQSVNWADGRQQQITNQMDKLWSVTLFIVYMCIIIIYCWLVDFLDSQTSARLV